MGNCPATEKQRWELCGYNLPVDATAHLSKCHLQCGATRKFSDFSLVEQNIYFYNHTLRNIPQPTCT